MAISYPGSLYLAFESLVNKVLISLESLETLTNWRSMLDNVYDISMLLECFELPRIYSTIWFGGSKEPRGPFEAPVAWLTVIIATSRSDVSAILRSLETTRFLGIYDTALIEQLPKGVTIMINSKEMKCEERHT